MLAGLTLQLIFKILAWILGVCAIVWGILKFLGASEEADAVESLGNKILNIFEFIIKYLFYAIVILIIYFLAKIT